MLIREYGTFFEPSRYQFAQVLFGDGVRGPASFTGQGGSATIVL